MYPTGNDGMYHRPEKCVRDAHAKDARDRVSGMHECSIMNFTYCCSLRIAAPPGEQLSLRFTCMNRDAWHGRASNNVKPFATMSAGIVRSGREMRSGMFALTFLNTVPVKFVAKVSRIILMREVEGSFSFVPPGAVHR